MNKNIKTIMAAIACIALCGAACAKPAPGNGDRRGDSGRGRGGDTHQQRREPTGGYRTEHRQQQGGYSNHSEHHRHHHDGAFARNERVRNDSGFHNAGSWRDGWYVRPAPPTPPTPPTPPPPPPPPPRRF